MIAVTYFTAYWDEQINSKHAHIRSGDWPYSLKKLYNNTQNEAQARKIY